jgi:hypothetical protein
MNRALAFTAALCLLTGGAAGAQEAIPTAQHPAADAPSQAPADAVSTLEGVHDRYDDGGPGPLIGPCGPTGANAKGDGPDHKAHGEVSVGVGTRGYREAGAVVCQPLGDNSALTIAVDAGRVDSRRR